MNLVKMVQMCNMHLGNANYDLAKALAARIGEILKAAEGAPEKLAEEANCCCPLRDRAESRPTSCEVCWWEARQNLDFLMGKLGTN